MALAFDGSLHLDGELPAAISGSPLTMACWFRVPATQDSPLITISNRSETSSYYELGVRSDGRLACVVRESGWQPAFTASSYTNDEWHHAAAVVLSDTQWYSALDGAPGSTASYPATSPTDPDTLGIGRLVRPVLPPALTGDLAEVAVWNEALPAEAVDSLSRGISPLALSGHSESLCFYREFVGEVSQPAIGPEPISYGTHGWADHPSVLRPSHAVMTGRPLEKISCRVAVAGAACAGTVLGQVSVAGAAAAGTHTLGEVW